MLGHQGEGSISTDQPSQNYNKTRTKAHDVYKPLLRCLRGACGQKSGCFRYLMSEE